MKGAKREQRTHKGSGTPYFYVEGPIPYPDRTDWPSRTILTGEGGRTPSRFKHIVQGEGGARAAGRRAFRMGNALVVGLIERVGRGLIRELRPAHEAVAIPIEAGE